MRRAANAFTQSTQTPTLVTISTTTTHCRMVPILARFLTPLLCLVAALVALPHASDVPGEQLASLPYVICALAALIALIAHQGRELATALLAILCYWLIRNHLQAALSTQPAGQIFSLLALWLPIAIGALLLLPDTSWRHPSGIIAVLAAPLTALLMSGLFAINPLWFGDQASALLATSFHGLKLPTLAAFLFIGVSLLAVFRLLWRNNYADSSLLGCALLTGITLGWFQLANISAVLFATIGLVLLINQVLSFLHIGYRDELTQIANRRALHKAAKELRSNYSLAMVDIDHFKKINDKHGHDLGDQVLKVVAGKLRQVGSGGKVFRYGGEEFCLLFNGKNAEQTEEELEKLRQTIAEYDMVMRDKHSRPRRQKNGIKKRGATPRKSNIRITVSMGLADSSVADGAFERVMKAADNALYGAKRSGRNRLKVAA
ncbi:GGDEF domain-containing protein [Porticoccus sp. W117]|uniref:GGDEF domain-containing protein n=1 Tax=Porticoccus sp. W117 TaxID=3054777 RepID=UPI0025997EFC|nr:GGDEF domain-containing protein [Porticoccus sp. W117]MDM3871679.1 GGDEF domain-containing protein [Porticoccus sp. W117]